MDYATRQIQSIGMDAWLQELRSRKLHGLAITVSQKDIDVASETIKQMTISTVLTLAIAVLHDEFGFGHKRCLQFRNRFDSKADCLMGEWATWDDYIDMIKDELDIEIELVRND